jgi:hypothetical protein
MNAYVIFVGKPERRRPLERSRLMWEKNIKMAFIEIRWGDTD